MEKLNIEEYCAPAQCYCEENTYRFLEKLAIDPPKVENGPQPIFEGYAVFLTSYSAEPGQEVEPGAWKTAVPVVSGPKPTDIVYWDYHCVAAVKEVTPPADGAGDPTIKWWVVDYDTKMGRGPFKAPVHMELFFGFTLSAANKNAVAQLELKMRFVAAVEFLAVFRSDRRHMYLRALTKDGRWKKMTPQQLNNPANYQHPPPDQPLIQAPSVASLFLKGSINRQQAQEKYAAHLASGRNGAPNKTQNNIAQFLNTNNTAVAKGELVAIREVGQWIKTH